MKWITALLSKSTPISMTISKPQNPRFGNGSRACLGTRLRLRPRSQKIWKLFFFLLKFNMVCTFWIVLMCWCQKWFLKKWKNIIGMYFDTKSYLKSTRNHTAKHAPNVNTYRGWWWWVQLRISVFQSIWSDFTVHLCMKIQK
jgi:hypothetical protein